MQRKNITSGAPWERIGRAHAAFFSKTGPTCTMVEVSNLILPELLVEIEADAYLA